MTETLLNAIAPAANIGLRRPRAARGIITKQKELLELHLFLTAVVVVGLVSLAVWIL